MSKIIIAIGAMLLLTGCSLFKDKPRDITLVTDKIDVCSKPPKADKIIMRNVDFKIIKDELGIYWIAVTPKFYENLGVNMKEIKQHIKQKNSIVKYYESCHKEKDPKKDKKEK
jgi:glycyl-tRNA synthetase (class II)